MSAHPPATSTALADALRAKHLPPAPAWLAAFLATQRPGLPAATLLSTATFRLLAADLTTALAPPGPAHLLPADLARGTHVREVAVRGPVVVQVLDVADVGRSRGAQLEALARRARGETVRGRTVVRVLPRGADGEGAAEEDGAEPPEAGGAARRGGDGEDEEDEDGGGKGPHRVLLQDARGTTVWGFEVGKVPGVGLAAPIGLKMVLKDVVAARGMLLLDAKGASVLGGKIEDRDKAWREGRTARLKEALEAAKQEAEN